MYVLESETLLEVFLREELRLVIKRPSHESDVVDDGFRKISLGSEVPYGSRAVTLTQFLSVLAHYHRKVAVDRRFPAECLIEKDMKRSGRNPLLCTHDMCDAHHMVVDYVGKMVCGESIALEKNRVGRDILVLACYVAHENIVECRLALCRDTKSDNRLDALCLKLFSLFFREVCTVSVIALVLALGSCLLLSQLFQSLGRTVTIVCLTVSHELLGVLLIDIESFGLHIRTIGTAHYRALIPFDSEPFESVVEILERLLGITLPVGVFYAENELTSHRLGEKVVE